MSRAQQFPDESPRTTTTSNGVPINDALPTTPSELSAAVVVVAANVVGVVVVAVHGSWLRGRCGSSGRC
eukprot:7684645-Lingulodinium_polyedra.AAC.1